MAEREGFEPPLPFRVNLISSPSRTTTHLHRPPLSPEKPGEVFLPFSLPVDRCAMVQAQFRHRIRHTSGTGQPFRLERSSPFQHALDSQSRESLRTNGSKEVSRRETKRVFLARAGRRSTGSRGAEVEREMEERSGTQGRRPTTGTGESLSFLGKGLASVWGSVRGGVARAFRGPITSGPSATPECARPSERQEIRAPARTTRRGEAGGTVGHGGVGDRRSAASWGGARGDPA